MNVRACMTINPVVAKPLMRLGDALELMSRRQLRHLPVIEADGTFVGMICDYDIRAAVSADGDEALERGVLALTELGTPILGGDDSTEKAWATLSRSPGSNPLPVVTDGKLEGTVSQHDLLRAMAGLPRPAESGNGEESHRPGSVAFPLSAETRWTASFSVDEGDTTAPEDEPRRAQSG
jgi:acetoin utilization protein AcuB